MSSTNPYSMSGQVAAADAPVAERVKFLQRTYSWLLGGVLAFAAILAAWGQSETLQSMTGFIGGNWIIAMVVIFGVSFFAHAVAEKTPLNMFAYGAVVLVYGLLIGPIVAIISAGHGTGIITQASVITAVIFMGLTAYVFISGKDFSFMRGFLTIGLVGLIITGVVSAFMGGGIGIWYSYVAAALFSGYILYDTSRILHHYPTTAHVSAALVLFVDVVILFKHILIILASNDD
ncbi:MAG: Bax inhibitor-1 family protein [Planctomycetota bacterium]